MKKKLLIVINVDWFYVSHFKALGDRIMSNGYELHLATEFTKHTQFLSESGVNLHEIQLSRSSSTILSEIKTFFNIFLIFLKVNPSIIQLFTIKPVIYGGICSRILGFKNIISYITGLGYIFTFGNTLSKFKLKVLKTFYKISLDINEINIICENEFDFRFLKDEIIVKTRNLIRYNLIRGAGVDIEKFKFTPLPSGIPIIILPARLLWQKGVKEFIDAARILKAQNVLARFCLVGNPDPDNPSSVSRQTIVNLKKEGLVEFWGHRDDMPNAFSCASFVVLPSYREGLPKALIEAASCGRAIITSDVPGCRDAIVENETGLLVPVADSVALAKSIKLLLDNMPYARKLGVAGRLHAEKYFSINLITGHNLQIINSLLNFNRCI